VNLLRRYLIVAVLKGVGMVLAVLLAVTTVIGFVGQLGDVGTADYHFPQAATYVALRTPRMIFEMLPAAALIGALFSLGNLAVHRELIVMRASGVSNAQLLGTVGMAGFGLLIVMVLLGESLAPSLGAYAREMRAQALHTDVGLAGRSAWLREGAHILNLRRQSDEFEFRSGILLFEIGPGNTLRQVARADSAELDAERRWVLVNYAETTFTENGVVPRQEREGLREYDLSPDLLDLSVVRHDLLDTPTLRRYIDYLQANDLDASRYQLAYWGRIANTASVLLMTVLALPFVFGTLRSAGAGARLLVGLVIGLGYYMASQLLLETGQVFHLHPILVAWAPSAVLLVVAAVAFARMR
jgi:lipopolysaccharide export system permease protein